MTQSVLLLLETAFKEWDGSSLTVYGAFVSVLLTIVSFFFVLFWRQLRHEQGVSTLLRGEVSAGKQQHIKDVKEIAIESKIAIEHVTNVLANLSDTVADLDKPK